MIIPGYLSRYASDDGLVHGVTGAVADSGGRLINHLAHLGPDAVYLTPDVGGSSMTTRLRMVDLAGLADHVFRDLRPDINAEQVWKVGDPRIKSDYYLLDPVDHGTGGMHIRKYHVTDPAMLPRLVAGQQSVLDHYGSAPPSSCGDTLRPGQVLDR
ncbi:hypothetical protein GCM10029964_058700 [Kibdelosporangium lantanae]